MARREDVRGKLTGEEVVGALPLYGPVDEVDELIPEGGGVVVDIGQPPVAAPADDFVSSVCDAEELAVGDAASSDLSRDKKDPPRILIRRSKSMNNIDTVPPPEPHEHMPSRKDIGELKARIQGFSPLSLIDASVIGLIRHIRVKLDLT